MLRSASDPRDSTPIPTEVGPTTLSSSCSHWRVVCRLLSNTSTPCVLMMATPCLCRRNSLPQAGFQRSKSLYAIVFFAEFRRRRAPGLFLRPPDPHFGGDKPMGSSGPWAGSGSTRLQARDVSDRIMFIDRGVIDCPIRQKTFRSAWLVPYTFGHRPLIPAKPSLDRTRAAGPRVARDPRRSGFVFRHPRSHRPMEAAGVVKVR